MKKVTRALEYSEKEDFTFIQWAVAGLMNLGALDEGS